PVGTRPRRRAVAFAKPGAPLPDESGPAGDAAKPNRRKTRPSTRRAPRSLSRPFQSAAREPTQPEDRGEASARGVNQRERPRKKSRPTTRERTRGETRRT